MPSYLGGEKIDMVSTVRYVATALTKESCAVIIADLVGNYRHGVCGDIARIAKAGVLEDPQKWLIDTAIQELGDQLILTSNDEMVELAPGMYPRPDKDQPGTLMWRDEVVTAEIYAEPDLTLVWRPVIKSVKIKSTADMYDNPVGVKPSHVWHKVERANVRRLLEMGKKEAEIVDITGYPRTAVRSIMRFLEGWTACEREHGWIS